VDEVPAEGEAELSDEPKCFMDDQKWHQCCCSCVHHLPTHIDCTNVVSKGDHKGCICDIQIGWACCVEIVMIEKDQTPRIYPNWPEHSIGCEMFEKRDNESA
jgi:hypothetical protein